MVLVMEKPEILDAAAMEEIHFGVDSRCMNVVYLNKVLRTLRAFMRTVFKPDSCLFVTLTLL